MYLFFIFFCEKHKISKTYIFFMKNTPHHAGSRIVIQEGSHTVAPFWHKMRHVGEPVRNRFSESLILVWIWKITEFTGSPSEATKDRRCKASSGGCRLSGRHADPENHDYEGILQ